MQSPWLHEYQPVIITPNAEVFQTSAYATMGGVFSERSFTIGAGGSVTWINPADPLQLLSLRLSPLEEKSIRCQIFVDDIIVADSHWTERPMHLQAELRHGARITIQAMGECSILFQDAVITSPSHIVSPFGLSKLPRLFSDECTTLCVATTCDDHYAPQALELAGSLWQNSQVDAQFIVFGNNLSQRWVEKLEKQGVFVIPGEQIMQTPGGFYSSVYCTAQFAISSYYLFLDADTRIVNTLIDFLNTMRQMSPDTIFVSRDNTIPPTALLGNALSHVLAPFGGDGLGAEGTLSELNLSASEYTTRWIAQGGFLAGSRKAILSLESVCRQMMPYSQRWIENVPKAQRAEQALLSLATVRHGSWAEVSPTFYSDQLHSLTPCSEKGLQLQSHDTRIIHFKGEQGKQLTRSALIAGVFSDMLKPTKSNIYRDIANYYAINELGFSWQEDWIDLKCTLRQCEPMQRVICSFSVDYIPYVFAQDFPHISLDIYCNNLPQISQFVMCPHNVNWTTGDPITNLNSCRMDSDRPEWDCALIHANCSEKSFQSTASLLKHLTTDSSSLIVCSRKSQLSAKTIQIILNRTGWQGCNLTNGVWSAWKK